MKLDDDDIRALASHEMDGCRPPWKYENPLCAEIGTELYFLEEVDGKLQAPHSEYNKAKSLCMQCQHLIECRVWGLNNEQHGMWGGLSSNERRAVKQRLRLLTLPESVELKSA